MRFERITRFLRPATSGIKQPTDNALLCQGLRRMLLDMSSHLVGLSEIATMLSISRQRASQLVRDYDDFPEPVAELASGRIWDTAAVEAWANAHPVRPPGRPSTGSSPGEEV